MTDRLQLFGAPRKSHFLTLDSVVQDSVDGSGDYLMETTLMLTSKKQVSKRQVMTISLFLAYTGGYLQSILLIGTVLNFMLSGHSQSLQLLQDFFKINQAAYEPGKRSKWLTKFGTVKLDWFQQALFASVLRYLPCIDRCTHAARYKRILTKVES